VNVAIDGEPVFFGYEPDETLTIIPIWDTLGLRATRSQLLAFDETLLKDSHRATNPPGRFNAINAGLSNISIGVAQAALDALIDHARNRAISGRPLSHQQWVQYEVADVEIKLTAVKAATRRALRLADLGDPASFAAIDRAKYLANKVAVEIAQLGVRIGGASGFLRGSPIQRHLRDAQAGQLMAYSTEVIAGQVGKLVLGVDEESARAEREGDRP
jgi:alkylation response protein AidB-like acyl-CoA dehydrogenase